MTITAIEEQKKNKERVNIFLDGQFSFGLHLDVLLDYQLKIGSQLDDQQVAEIKTADAFRQSYDKALGYLARRPRSTHEVRQYLRQKLIFDHPDYRDLDNTDAKSAYAQEQNQSIERIIDRLQEQQLLDDAAFAKWWIENRLKFRPRGKRLLLVELKAKGVSNQDIQTALTTPDDEGHFKSEVGEAHGDPELSAALAVAQKYAAKHQHLPLSDQKQKLTRHLAGKGFDWDTINQVLQALEDSGEDSQA